LLDKITAEVRRLNRTISSGLEFVRPVSVSLTESSILRVLDEAVTVACKRRGTDSIVVESRVDRSIPPILMDRAQIRQVFENLVLNAIEAVGDEGRVLIEAELRPAGVEDGTAPEEPLLEVRVSDDGPGIPDEEKDKIFYPFFTTKTEGSGVGLSMAKKIVDCHRGVIDVDRGPEGGARFTVRLPMTQIDGRMDNP
jgi:signal transduction histidine kinase